MPVRLFYGLFKLDTDDSDKEFDWTSFINGYGIKKSEEKVFCKYEKENAIL
jgi:hypothetical protein